MPKGPPHTWCSWGPCCGRVCSTSYPTETLDAFPTRATKGRRSEFDNDRAFPRLGETGQWMGLDATSGAPPFEVTMLDLGWMFLNPAHVDRGPGGSAGSLVCPGPLPASRERIAPWLGTCVGGAAFEERLAFETMLSDLSSRFATLPPEAVESEIEDALRRHYVKVLEVTGGTNPWFRGSSRASGEASFDPAFENTESEARAGPTARRQGSS